MLESRIRRILATNSLTGAQPGGISMGWTRICVGISMCIVLAGCGLLLGDGIPLGAAMHRASDGANAMCMTGSYHPIFGAPGARRALNACILACRKHGFLEDGESTQIDETALTPDDYGDTPTICRG
jgi:hypothetical protein